MADVITAVFEVDAAGNPLPGGFRPISKLDSYRFVSLKKFVQTADVTVSGTTTETSLVGAGSGSMLFEGGTLGYGRAARLTMDATVVTPLLLSPGLTLRATLGATALASLVVPASLIGGLTGAGVVIGVTFRIVVRAGGVSGRVITAGSLVGPQSLTSLSLAGVSVSPLSPVAVDLTPDLMFGLTAQWVPVAGGTAAGASITSSILNLETIT